MSRVFFFLLINVIYWKITNKTTKNRQKIQKQKFKKKIKTETTTQKGSLKWKKNNNNNENVRNPTKYNKLQQKSVNKN